MTSAQGCSGPTISTIRSLATRVVSSRLSRTTPSTKPSSAAPPITAEATCAVLPMVSRTSMPGITAAERHQVMRQPIAGDGLARLHQQPAPPQPGQFGQGQLRRLGPRQHRARLGQEHPAGLGQLDTAADAVEQARAVPSLQRGDCGTDGRLRQVQRARRLGHVLPFGDGDEDMQLFQGHAGCPSSSVASTRAGSSAWRDTPERQGWRRLPIYDFAGSSGGKAWMASLAGHDGVRSPVG